MNINRYLVEAPIDDQIDWNGSDKKFKDDLITYLKAEFGGNIGNILRKFDGKFLKYFADCMSKTDLSDKKNLFLNYLTDAKANSIINNITDFKEVYNILIKDNFDFNNDKDYTYVRNMFGDCILFMPEFWDNIEEDNQKVAIANMHFHALKDGNFKGLTTSEIESDVKNRQIRELFRKAYGGSYKSAKKFKPKRPGRLKK